MSRLSKSHVSLTVLGQVPSFLLRLFLAAYDRGDGDCCLVTSNIKLTSHSLSKKGNSLIHITGNSRVKFPGIGDPGSYHKL